jgi:superfamily II DNA or RNA helicase
MSRSIRLRPWQKRALDALTASADPDFLTVATPGAGKTTFALTAVLQHLADEPGARVVVVAPTQHLKRQWASAAAQFGLHLQPSWSAREGRLPSDMHGIVVTYQQVAATADQVRGIAAGAIVIFDEIHHAGDDRAWGEAVRAAFEPAARRLSLSGTPFRSDTSAIPFIRYVDGEALPDYQYGYGEALAEGRVVRPVYFPRTNGNMEWAAPDGSVHSHTFDDQLDRTRASQRLRTALSVEGEWLPTVLAQAHGRLTMVRRQHRDAGGLVIAMDQEHAHGVAGVLRARLGVEPVVATSEDASASAKISAFAAGQDPWIVAVRMVSEGVDIPRLRVGVYATNTTTELFFRQAVGRLVRWRRGTGSDPAAMFIPDDPRLRHYAVALAEQRNHSLRKRRESLEARQDAPLRPTGADEQLSLFAAISAVATDTAELGPGADDDLHLAEDIDDGIEVFLPPPPSPGGDEADAAPRHEHKRALRAYNADRAKMIVQLTGMGHANVNGELNRLAGVRSISEATVRQLQRRLAHADRWLQRL